MSIHRTRYSRWDGSQQINALTADDIMRSIADELVDVAPSEPHGANVVVVGDQVVMGTAFPETADRIAAYADFVHRVDLTEFAKADGCATCLSLVFTV
jgi:N-dimethylarginine dimethylaminohydrolase